MSEHTYLHDAHTLHSKWKLYIIEILLTICAQNVQAAVVAISVIAINMYALWSLSRLNQVLGLL